MRYPLHWNSWFGFMLLPAAVLGLATGPAAAQSVFDRIGSVETGVEYQTYNIKAVGEPLTQFALPMAVTLPVGRGLTLNAATAGIHTELSNYQYEYIGDTRLRASYVFPGDWLLITAGVNVPTGQTRLTDGERELAYLIARDALNMPYPSFGQGWQANFGFAVARHVHPKLVLGVGGSGIYTHSYRPWEDNADSYNPGDEFTLIVGFDYLPAWWSKFTFDVGVTQYREDKLNQQWVFQRGRQLYFDTRWQGRLERVSWEVYLQNRAILNDHILNFGYFEREPKNSNGHEIDTGLNLLLPTSDLLAYRFVAEGRVYAQGTLAMGDATLGGAGAGFVIGRATGWRLDLQTLFMKGRMDILRTKKTITGMELRAMVGYHF